MQLERVRVPPSPSPPPSPAHTCARAHLSIHQQMGSRRAVQGSPRAHTLKLLTHPFSFFTRRLRPLLFLEEQFHHRHPISTQHLAPRALNSDGTHITY